MNTARAVKASRPRRSRTCSEPLISAVGLDKILRAFKNSGIVCFAFAEDRLIGACRAITDSEYHAFVYDVAVHPDYQGRGVGKSLMTRLLSGVSVWRVMLVAEGEVQGFYRQFGFAPYNDVMATCDAQRLFDRTE